jgi:hypothetical protein
MYISLIACRYECDSKCKVILSSLAAWYHFIGKGKTSLSRVSLRSIHTWWKYYLISFQIHPVWPQYHVGKASKLLRCVVVVSTGSYVNIMNILFILGILAHAPRRWRTWKGSFWTSSSLATTFGGYQCRPSQVRGPIHVKIESILG